MPQYMKGDMWSALENNVDHFIITTNAMVKRNGALVMGAGIAKQVRDRYPGIDVDCGRAVEKYRDHLNTYGCLINVVPGERSSLGLFQVKHHWAEQADLELIENSTTHLYHHAQLNQGMTFALNFPGIGNGKLSYDQVKPIIDTLPDNVQVWTFK